MASERGERVESSPNGSGSNHDRLLPTNKEMDHYFSRAKQGTKEKSEPSFDRCEPDYIVNYRGDNRDSQPTEKRTQYNHWANDALNAPDRPAPTDLTADEQTRADKLVKAVTDYYESIRKHDSSNTTFNDLQTAGSDLSGPAGQRIIDAANAKLKDQHLRIASVPESGEIWVGSPISDRRYGIGALIKPVHC